MTEYDADRVETGEPTGPTPVLAVVGRPNVGKSTLFNRLAARRIAIVDDTPGVTRDRKEAPARIGGREVLLVDTAGLEEAAPETIQGRMRASSEEALRRVREDACAAPGPDPEGESTLGVDDSGLEDDGEARRRFEELGSVAGCDDDGSGRFADVDVLARTDGADAEATGEGRASEPPSFPSMPFA